MKKIKMIGHNMILNYLTFKERLEYTIGEPKSIAKYLIIFDPEVSTYYLIDGISGDVLRTTSSLNELIDFMHSQSPGLVALHNIKSNEVSDYKPDFVYFFVDEGKFVNLDLSSLNIEGTTVIDSSRVLQNIASIEQTLTPSADNTYDLGSSSLRWKNGYFGGDLEIDGNIKVAQAFTVPHNLTNYRDLKGLFTLQSIGDILRFRSPVKVEYYDESSGTWVEWTDADFSNVLDGRHHDTGVTIDYTHRKFRLTFDLGSWKHLSYLLIAGEYPTRYVTVTIEASKDLTNWTTLLSPTTVFVGYRVVLFPSDISDNSYIRITFDVQINSGETWLFTGLSLFSCRHDPARNFPILWNFDKHVYPHQDNTQDLGISTYRWKNIYFAGTLFGNIVDISSLKIGGTEVLTSSRVLQNIDSVAQTLTPSADNTYDLGSSTLRWRDLYAVNVYTGDILFQNSWKITEYNESGQLMNGLRILNKNGEEIFKITEEGLYFKGKKIA